MTSFKQTFIRILPIRLFFKSFGHNTENCFGQMTYKYRDLTTPTIPVSTVFFGLLFPEKLSNKETNGNSQ
jgi:hypothetical protein